MPKVKVNDIEMYYEVHGEGEPIVFLHGFSWSNQMWNPFIPDFKEHYQLIIPDLRGHGRTTNPSKKFTHRQSALDIFALLDHLKIERFKAVGWSSGGMTLIHMATQEPNRVEAMILISASSHFPKECREKMAQENIDDLTEDQWNYYRSIHLHGDEQIRLWWKQFYEMKDSYDDMNFTPPYLSTITAKTLIIHGDRDGFFPVSIPVNMYNSIPNSYLWITPNTGHLLAVKKYVSEIKREALEFLSGSWDE